MMRWWGPGGVAIALLLSQAPAAAVRVATARVYVLAEPGTTSIPLGAVRYGQVLPLIGSADGWDHVTVVVGSTRVDGFVAASAVVPAPASATIDATMIREGGVTFSGAKVTPGEGVAVALDTGGKTRWLQATLTRVVPLDASAGTPESTKLRAALDGQTPMPADPAAVVTWAWFVPATGLADAGSRSPAISVLYPNATSLAVERVQPALVKLPVASEAWRLVARARGRADEPFRDVADWAIASVLVESDVAGTRAEGGNGLMKIRLAGPLGPGDYAVVLRDLGGRPLAGGRLFSGSPLAAGDVILYDTVWPFRVQ
jgi:hypothetical protein